jgi:penicillin amidase
MPNSENPEKGWLGTCNHKTVTEDYPYYYSSYFATSFRYRRLKELLEAPGTKTIDDHWGYQRDTKNIMAQNLAPVYAKILMKSDDTKGLGKILSNWNHRDDPDQSGPTIFQLTHRNLAYSVFQDELGDDITDTMIHHIYYWQERLQNMILSGESPWFDNKLTEDKKETLSDLVHQAALEASKTLGAEFGDDPRKWLWGEAHQIEFVNPIRRNGFGKSLVGGMKFPMGGSSENLYCAWYDYRKPLDVVLSASLRMVADLGDDEKVLAVLPGGVTGRTFDEHLNDQVPKFMKGDKVYWWFSDEAINKHTKNVLTLNPTP